MTQKYHFPDLNLTNVLFLLTILLSPSCTKPDTPESTAVPVPDMADGQKIILYAEFMHEVNSFSPVVTTEINFRADHLFYGDDVAVSAIEENKQLAGFLTAVEKTGRGRIKAKIGRAHV